MRSDLVPAISTPWATPAATVRARRDLEQANVEMSSGKYADVGLRMGARSVLLVEARTQSALLKGLSDAAATGAGRLEVVQQSLEQASGGAQTFLQTLAPLQSGQGDPAIAVAQAKNMLEEFTAAINATSHGSSVFGGQNISETPLAEYFSDPPSAARQAVDAAFLAKFGFTQDDPAAANITAAQMEDFIDNEFAGLFGDPDWGATWSSAGDEGMMTLVSLNDIVPVTASANNPAIRTFAKACVMVASLGTENLNASARAALAGKAMTATGEAISGFDRMRGEAGINQERVSRAAKRLEAQNTLVEKQIAGMEQVDLYEAANRVNALTTQLETAYALTGRLQNLTLLRYLPA